MPGPRRPGPVLPVARDRAKNQIAIQLVKHVPAEAEPCHHARPVAFHHGVRARGQAFEQLTAAVRLEIESEAALVAVDGVEEDALAVFQGRGPAHVIASDRLFDLDHVGAPVGQQHGAECPRQKPGQVEYAKAVQRHLAGFIVACVNRGRT